MELKNSRQSIEMKKKHKGDFFAAEGKRCPIQTEKSRWMEMENLPFRIESGKYIRRARERMGEREKYNRNERKSVWKKRVNE